MCRNFLLRYITIGNGKPSSVESEVGKLARNFNGDMMCISKKFKEISKDNELEEQLKTLKVSFKSYYTYLLLVKLEEKKHINEKWVCPGRKDITIEHILPQNIEGTEWTKLFTHEQAELYVNRLGNLTLLGATGNSKIKNRSFEDKKKFYSESTDMKITKLVSSYDKWTSKEINLRQKEMSSELMDILKLEI